MSILPLRFEQNGPQECKDKYKQQRLLLVKFCCWIAMDYRISASFCWNDGVDAAEESSMGQNGCLRFHW